MTGPVYTKTVNLQGEPCRQERLLYSCGVSVARIPEQERGGEPREGTQWGEQWGGRVLEYPQPWMFLWDTVRGFYSDLNL